MKKSIIAVSVVLVLFAACTKKETLDHPNIVWISLEDITPMMGCYGDGYAKTPVFDQLAAEGILYTKAYAPSPVCSPSRSGIITGIYPTSLGTIHHRSHRTGPGFLTMIPTLMREAGYYATNNAKMDYNLPGNPWDESSGTAHWRNRPDKDQPFFSVFNFGECHSSITKIPEDRIVEERLNRLRPEDFHDPELAPIPPYHPDVPEFRKAWSRYYDAVTQVDYRAGEIIEQLKEDGLWENTIVFVWADHGVGMPRGKHNVWEQGLHVPLIVRFPSKYRHLAPARPGSVKDDLISLIDLGPSTMKLAGIDTPDFMDGRPLLCKSKAEKREYVFAARGRLDSRFEMVRSVRDKRYRYQHNFYPHLPYKPYEDYEFNAPVLQKWVELARMGKLTGPQEMPAMRFKPVEELYDSENDQYMINNLADDPEYTEVLERMRKELHNWMVETRDLGILEEAELVKRSEGKQSQWDLGQQLENYEEILETAELMSQGETAIPELLARAKDPDAAIRFWAMLGLVTCRSGDREVIAALQLALRDESVSVRLSAVEGLFNLQRYEEALPVVIAALDDSIIHARVRAAGILDSQPPEANEKLQAAIEPLKLAAEKTDVYNMSGIPFGLNYPFKRAIKAISGEEVFYRWGDGASGTPGEHLPYPQSDLVTGFSIDTVRLSIGHGDNWAITWADDDKQYSFFCDGKGFGTHREDVSIAPVVLEGVPPKVTGKDIHSASGTLSLNEGGNNSAKVCGLVMIRGTLYAWVRNINLPGTPKGTGSRLMFSKDHARTWEWVDWNWPSIGYPTWLNAGKNYMDARDEFAYFISPDGPSAYFDYDSMLMARVRLPDILHKEKYTFFGGIKETGEARWVVYEDRKAFFRHDGGCFRPDIVFNPGLKRYFLSIATPAKVWAWWSADHAERMAHFGIFEAPDPWGPWKTVFFEEDWGAPENRFSPHIPPKWISKDGRTFFLLYSCIPVGPYRFNIQKCTITGN